MIRLAVFKNVDEIRGMFSRERGRKIDLPTEHGDVRVKSSSVRLQCFKRSRVCIRCGRVGDLFALEKHVEGEVPHLNLYAVDPDGSEVLMTYDHVVPKSKGGADSLSNTQTMCLCCNMMKGDIDPYKQKPLFA